MLTTCGSQEEARRFAHDIVSRQFAACVNIVPGIESVYRWQGDVETSTEWLLLIKTTAEAFQRLREAMPALHSYEVPECISIPIEDGAGNYLQWIADSVTRG